jgi:hypothetical protein
VCASAKAYPCNGTQDISECCRQNFLPVLHYQAGLSLHSLAVLHTYPHCMHGRQVLPPSMLLLAEPQPEALVAALEAALARVPTVDRLSQHCQVRAPSF